MTYAVGKMNKVLYSTIIILSGLPAIAFGCKPESTATDSMEPVPIKIGDLYFNIPEHYLPISFLRAPAERDYVQFMILSKDLLLKPQDNTERWIQIQILKDGQQGRATRKIKLSERVAAATSLTPRVPGSDTKDEINHIEHYLKSISSATPPKNWKYDSKLAARMALGQDPCAGWAPTHSKRQEAKKAEQLPYDIVMKALEHRLANIRQGAVLQLKNIDESHRVDAVQRLRAILQKDKSEDVRITTIRVLKEYAKTDEALYPEIIEVTLHDDSRFVRRIASDTVAQSNSNIAEKLIEISKNSSLSNQPDIANALAWIINKEVGKNKITAPENLTHEGKIALHGLIEILSHANDSSLNDHELTTLLQSKSAIATPEYLEFLHKLQANGSEFEVMSANRALQEVK